MPKSCEGGDPDMDGTDNVAVYYNNFLPEVDELSQNAQDQSTTSSILKMINETYYQEGQAANDTCI